MYNLGKREEKENMSLKESNEITLKIKCELNEFYKIIEEKALK